MDRGRTVPDVKGVIVAGQLRRAPTGRGCGTGWGLEVLSGRLVEVSGTGATASLTMVARVMLEAQRRGDSVAWVTAQDSIFFPPDLLASGIDLGALPVVRVTKAYEVARSAETLLRSGGFALVVLDLGRQQSMSLAVQTRLAGLARRHEATLLALTRKRGSQPSLGSLVAVRADCTRQQRGSRQFDCELRILKDKRGGSAEDRQCGVRHTEQCSGPGDLC